MPKQKKIKVIKRKLGREKAVAQCYMGENLIEIDPRVKNNKEYFSNFLHELIHLTFPEIESEKRILEAEKFMVDALWEQNFRKVDN